VTYMAVCRAAAVCESRALRAYARAGLPTPRCRPVDLWNEWTRQQKRTPSSFTRKAA
jgi:hypothetical protein